MRKKHTLRGVAGAGSKEVIFDNDLRGVGWRVTNFIIIPNNMDVAPYVWGKLWMGNDLGGSLGFSDMTDNRCIAWGAASSLDATSRGANRWSFIDPDHIITNQLHIHSGSGDSAAYFIELEQMDITTDQEILALIKERSQDDIDG
jgi:hypothetical protein